MGSSWIQTASGGIIDFEDGIFEIEAIDVARGLGRLCRFSGQLAAADYYSVAEHSVLVTEYARRHGGIGDGRMLRTILMHDASEAYLGDVPGPIKRRFLDEYVGLEHELMGRMARMFDFHWPLPRTVRTLDERMLLTECQQVLAEPARPWDLGSGCTPLPGVVVENWRPAVAIDRMRMAMQELGIALP